jgi:hypothetical protein
MKKLIICDKCNRRIGCTVASITKKCYYCEVMDCPFEETVPDYYAKITCDFCKGILK